MTRIGLSTKTPTTQANKAQHNRLESPQFATTNRKTLNMTGCAPKVPPALTTPSVNRGVGFTHQQRRELGLTRRLPSGVLTLEQQAARVWRQLQSMPTDLARNVLLDQLRSRNEILYFKVRWPSI